MSHISDNEDERILVYNNSDDEEMKAKDYDFVSFPTLPDPEEEHKRTLGNILTKTIRKVTNNASHLVNNYNPQSMNQDSSPSQEQRDDTKRIPTLTTKIISTGNNVYPYLLELIDHQPVANTSTSSKEDNAVAGITLPQVSEEVNSMEFPKRSSTVTPSIISETESSTRITSDNKGLRISTMKPSLQMNDNISTSSVMNINALATTERLQQIAETKDKVPSKNNDPGEKDSSIERIASIFNNLPNDIELSDDSASDLETLNNSSMVHSPGESADILDTNQLGYESKPMSKSVINKKVLGSSNVSLPYRSKEINPTIKKKSSNISTLFFYNAKSILNANISNGLASSASTIRTLRKKKGDRKKRHSENPLKNGGIPKKYWMNDAFVSECLNCFKPFSAFRRKHHCRFCGQIYCADCTMFISYKKHKEERNGKSTNKKTYNDKLRVCKPCYSDVIVYLSDDSSESDLQSEIEEEALLIRKFDDSDFASQIALMKSRSRSLSAVSRPDMDLIPKYNNDLYTYLESPIHKSDIEPTNPPQGTESLSTSYNDNLKKYVKHAPQLAIPTTRAGESVEIPVSNSSYNSRNIHNYFNNGIPLTLSTPMMDSKTIHGKNWLKNYTHFGNFHSPEVKSAHSLDNISHMYNNFIGKIQSPGYKKKSQSEKDISSIINRSMEITTSSDDSDLDVEREDFDSDEDEKVMSLYTSLNLTNQNLSVNRSPRSTVSKIAVPTLREFPLMMANDKQFPRTSLPEFPNSSFRFTAGNSNQMQGKNDVNFLYDRNERPKVESMRSHERAHASLLRMRSRRQSKATRNLLLLSQNSNKLNLIDTNLGPSHITPPVSPTPHSFTSRIVSNDHSSVSLKYNSGAEDTNNINSKNFLAVNTAELLSDKTGGSNNSPFVDKNLIDSTNDITEDFSEYESMKKALIYKDYLARILTQCLDDCGIVEDKERWIKASNRILLYINEVKLTDTLDIKQYVKIKRILGGNIEETNSIDGLFFTKNIDSRKMCFKIENPKIALLMFPVEYLKQKEQFISLRIVHSQESVYISNLVSRLISLKPDIIIIGDSICGLAEKQLEEANITVISNTKPQVIERLSRYTKADIYQSVNDLFFKKGTLGTCKVFEIKKYAFKNEVKTYAFFTGNDISAGFTVCLRGGDEEVLRNVKYSVETLVPGVLNSKLELSLLNDSSLTVYELNTNSKIEQISSILSEVLLHSLNLEDVLKYLNEDNIETPMSLDRDEVSKYIKLFSERVLSLSPMVRFELPKALVRVVHAYLNFFAAYQLDNKIQLLNSIDEVDEDISSNFNMKFKAEDLPNTNEEWLNLLKILSHYNVRSMLKVYQNRSRIWSNNIKASSYQLYPVFHKNIHLLFSSVSIKYSTPCLGPNIIVIDYYTDNDKCLGMFMDQIFRECNNICNECGESLLNHYKTYVHGNGKLDFMIEKYDNLMNESENSNQRLMWSYCKECDYSSPIVPMTDDTYYMSIGKFFELNFWAENVSLSQTDKCEHSYFDSFVRCFSFNDYVIRMEYSNIDNYEVSVPKKKLEFLPQTTMELKIETYNDIKKKMNNLFGSISKRLNRVKVDVFDKAEDGLKKIEELKDNMSKQLSKKEEELLQIYNNSSSTNYLSLNSLLRDLQEIAVDWDIEFNEFSKKYLPTENDITNLTQFHLKHFLMDRDSNENKTKSVELSELLKNKEKSEESNESSAQDDKQILATESDPQNDENSSLGDTSEVDKNQENLDRKSNSKSPTSLYQESNIIAKIHKMEQLFESERNGNDLNDDKKKKGTLTAKPSESSLNPQSQNKVSQLANFFNQMNLDQISMEFKKQREIELQKKMNKFKAIPVVESKPIVEIYNKIEDVVDVNEKPALKKLIGEKQSLMSPNTTGVTKENPKISPITSSMLKEDSVPKEEGSQKDTNKPLDMPQPEKQSLLKSLINFWADRSATMWDPLEYPLDSSEHTFADSDVIVREDEPSSLVAFCLSSDDYKYKIKSMREKYSLENDEVEPNELNIKKVNNFAKIEKKFKKNNANMESLSELERILIKDMSNHLKYQFLDGSTSFSCKIFFSEKFDCLRKACAVDDSFIQSLSRCVKWQSNGGKSGSHFLKTLDNRYILKELSKSELESFVSIAPFYFKYISQSTFNTLTTALAKIFGFYQIEIRNSINGKTFKMDFLIMENLFYNRKTTRIFDLKGSMRNRHVQQTGKENEVLLDENMIEYIYESPLFVKEHLKRLLRGSLFNDTSFLSAMDVMDYSLVIGIDDASKKLYIGIIDWLRAFTWDKKVENWVKGNNLIGKKNKDPTIVTPKQYRIRFREAMERYILEVPDIWYEGK